MSRFHAVYDKLYQALDNVPYEQLGISDEVKEQVIKFSPPFIKASNLFLVRSTALSLLAIFCFWFLERLKVHPVMKM